MDIGLFLLGVGGLLFVILLILMFVLVLQIPPSPSEPVREDLQKIKEQIISSPTTKKQKELYDSQVEE